MRKLLPRTQPLSTHSSHFVSSSDMTSQLWASRKSLPVHQSLCTKQNPLAIPASLRACPPSLFPPVLFTVITFHPLGHHTCPGPPAAASRLSSRCWSHNFQGSGCFLQITQLEAWKRQLCLRVSALGSWTTCCLPGDPFLSIRKGCVSPLKTETKTDGSTGWNPSPGTIRHSGQM